jgi:hypothetical protein
MSSNKYGSQGQRELHGPGFKDYIMGFISGSIVTKHCREGKELVSTQN